MKSYLFVVYKVMEAKKSLKQALLSSPICTVPGRFTDVDMLSEMQGHEEVASCDERQRDDVVEQ